MARWWAGKRLPTDLEILDAIYDRYYEVFATYEEGISNERSSKIYVPLNIAAIADDLGRVSLHIVSLLKP